MAPILYQHLVLDHGHVPDWAQAARAIGRLDHEDIEYLDFAMGLSADHYPDPDGLLARAREILARDLDQLLIAMTDPARHGLDRIVGDRECIYTVAGHPDDEGGGLYGSVLRLGLMYVTDAAGFRRHSPTDATGLTQHRQLRRCGHTGARRRTRANPVAYR